MKLLSSFWVVFSLLFALLSNHNLYAISYSLVTHNNNPDLTTGFQSNDVNNPKRFSIKTTATNITDAEKKDVIVYYLSSEGQYECAKLDAVVDLTFRNSGTYAIWAHVFRKSDPIVVIGKKIIVSNTQTNTTTSASIAGSVTLQNNSVINIPQIPNPVFKEVQWSPYVSYIPVSKTWASDATDAPTLQTSMTYLPTPANSSNDSEGATFYVVPIEAYNVPLNNNVQEYIVNLTSFTKSFYLHEILVDGKKLNINAEQLTVTNPNLSNNTANFKTITDNPNVKAYLVDNRSLNNAPLIARLKLKSTTTTAVKKMAIQLVYKMRPSTLISSIDKNEITFVVNATTSAKINNEERLVTNSFNNGIANFLELLSKVPRDPCFLFTNSTICSNTTNYNRGIITDFVLNTGSVHANAGYRAFIKVSPGLYNIGNTISAPNNILGWCASNNPTNPINLIFAYNLKVTNADNFNYPLNFGSPQPFADIATLNPQANLNYLYSIYDEIGTGKKVIEILFPNAVIEAFGIQNYNIFNNNFFKCLALFSITLPLNNTYTNGTVYSTRIESVLQYKQCTNATCSTFSIISALSDLSSEVTTTVSNKYTITSLFPYIQLNCGSGKEDMHNNEVPTSLSAYPNPFTETVRIDGLSANEHIEVYNFQGQIVQTADNTGANSMDIDLNAVPAGMYLVRVCKDTEIAILRLLKK